MALGKNGVGNVQAGVFPNVRLVEGEFVEDSVVKVAANFELESAE